MEQATHDIHFWIEPHEMIIDDFRSSLNNSATLFNVIQGDILTKEVRLWKNARFINPVFEQVDIKGTYSNNVILSEGVYPSKTKFKLLEEWIISSPAEATPYYYRALASLSIKEYQEFVKDANQYLFLNKDKNYIMLYYMACVYCYVMKDAGKALGYLASCILMKPNRAEFWCLLGDVHYHLLNSYNKAYIFYENAITLGGRRLANDNEPMEISKYKEYPQKMIDNCREILNSKMKVKDFLNQSEKLTTAVI